MAFGIGSKCCQCGHDEVLHVKGKDRCLYCDCKLFVDRNVKPLPKEQSLEREDWNG